MAGGIDGSSGTRGASGGSMTKPRANGRSMLTIGEYSFFSGPVRP